MCLRVVDPQDELALLTLHTLWGQLAEQFGDHVHAQRSYIQVIALTQRLAHDRDSSIHGPEDHELYMIAVAYRLKHPAIAQHPQ